MHWTPRTCRPELRLADPPITSTPVGLKFVGQHDHDGFYVGMGGGIEAWPATVEATEMGSLLGRALGLS